MLSEKALKEIAVLIKVQPEDLKKAIADEKEVDVTIPEGLTSLTTEELKTRDENQKKEGEKTGEARGRELGYKDIKKAVGLPDDAPSKDPAKLAEAILAKVSDEAKKEPDEVAKELKQQLKVLKETVADKDNKLAELEKSVSAAGFDRVLLTSLPVKRSDLLNDDEYISIIKSTLTVKSVDGKQIVERDGNVLRDSKTADPVSLKTAIEGFFKERKGWLTEEGAGAPGAAGRGGGDGDHKPSFAKKSEVIKHYEDQGISLQGEEGKKVVVELEKLAKENPEFDMNS